jgi:hypothetical protein
MFLEDRREFPRILSLKRPERCCNYPCRAPRAADDNLYCQRCREAITAEAWLLIECEEMR